MRTQPVDLHLALRAAAVAVTMAAGLMAGASPALADQRDDFLAGRSSDCPGCDLDHAELKRRDLTGANLAGARLTGATLHEANLSNADLSGADLSDANLNLANLRRAKLAGATLTGVLAYGANFASADLSTAAMTGIKLQTADLTGATLANANLQNADLRLTRAARADFSNAIVAMCGPTASCLGRQFRHANLIIRCCPKPCSKRRFTGANLAGANLRADLTGVTLVGTDLRRYLMVAILTTPPSRRRCGTRPCCPTAPNITASRPRSRQISTVQWKR